MRQGAVTFASTKTDFRRSRHRQHLYPVPETAAPTAACPTRLARSVPGPRSETQLLSDAVEVGRGIEFNARRDGADAKTASGCRCSLVKSLGCVERKTRGGKSSSKETEDLASGRQSAQSLKDRGLSTPANPLRDSGRRNRKAGSRTNATRPASAASPRLGRSGACPPYTTARYRCYRSSGRRR